MTQIQTPYKRTPHGEIFATKAAYKMLVYYTDKNKRTLYSREWNGNRKVMTEEVALSKLRKNAYSRKNLIETAVIYDNQTGEELYKFREGRWS